MRRHLVLIVSVGLNVALALVLFFPGRQSPSTTGEAVTNPPVASATNDVISKVVARKQFFSWQELESPDYPVYIEKLREIGCPEQTIRDIVIADVNLLYAKKQQAQVVTPDQQWWLSTIDSNVVDAANAKIQALDQERRSLLATLLGPAWESGNPARSVIALNGPVLGDLSPEAKQSVQNIVARAQIRAQSYMNAAKADGRTMDPAQLARIGQESRKDLALVLTPAQLEEFLLRYSSTAADMRRQLRGLDLAPEDFRNLFRARDPLYEQFELITGNDPNSSAERTALAKQLDETVKTSLGADRYKAFHLSQDPAYLDALTFAQQNNAPPGAVQNLYELNKAVQQERDRILNDPSLSAAQKTTQIDAANKEQQSVRDQIMGVEPPPASIPAEIMPPGLQPTQTHPYSPGETIDQIAAEYGVSANSIINANPALDVNRLQKGTPIKIPQQ